MRPDLQLAMRRTIEHGPGFCPRDLFAGPGAKSLLGLKAHANTISHARHIAMEETYPRTRRRLGAGRFHRLASAHLAQPRVCGRPLSEVGLGFAAALTGAERDLAALEWAWLQAYGAADQVPFDLAAIAAMTPATVASTQIALHPAANFLSVDHPIAFDDATLDLPAVLITRPGDTVELTPVGRDAVRLGALANAGRTLGDLLEADAAGATLLVASGALVAVSGAVR